MYRSCLSIKSSLLTRVFASNFLDAFTQTCLTFSMMPKPSDPNITQFHLLLYLLTPDFHIIVTQMESRASASKSSILSYRHKKTRIWTWRFPHTSKVLARLNMLEKYENHLILMIYPELLSQDSTFIIRRMSYERATVSPTIIKGSFESRVGLLGMRKKKRGGFYSLCHTNFLLLQCVWVGQACFRKYLREAMTKRLYESDEGAVSGHSQLLVPPLTLAIFRAIGHENDTTWPKYFGHETKSKRRGRRQKKKQKCVTCSPLGHSVWRKCCFVYTRGGRTW